MFFSGWLNTVSNICCWPVQTQKYSSVFRIELPDSFQFLESSPVFVFTRYFISLGWVILSRGKLAETKKEAWILKWYLQISVSQIKVATAEKPLLRETT